MATEVDHEYDEAGDDMPDSYEVELGEEDGPAEELNVDDPELEAIRARVREMEEEAKKIRAMQNEVEKQMNSSVSSLGSPLPVSFEDKMDTDARSVWIGNVDYGATAEELESHFSGCGSVSRVTILCDKFSGHPKGFAYIEFSDKDSVQLALELDDSLFRGRQIKVTVKRTNRPGISTTNRPPRGRFGRPRPSYFAGSYAPRYSRPRGRFRPRRSYYYSPY